MKNLMNHPKNLGLGLKKEKMITPQKPFHVRLLAATRFLVVKAG
jgi:hypothetical protein